MASPRAFTPSREDPALLDARTAGRGPVLASLARALRTTATTRNRPHVLLIGPRGAGKSHVIEVALHRMSADATVADRLAVVRLPEDVVGISSTADILVEVVRRIGTDRASLDAAVAARRNRQLVDLEQLVHRMLDGRTMLLVIENLDRVMDAIGPAGQDDLRAWVERSGDIAVLASAPLLFHAVQARDAPWFGSFEIIHLSPLSLAEGTALVASLAGERGHHDLAAFVLTPRGQARLAAIHHLAGGSPRIWTIFATCVDVTRLDELVPAAEALLEELVPYYQQRLWELPATEQKVLTTLATGPASSTVADLADAAGIQRDTAASTLGRLAEAGWVRSRKAPGTDQRTSWYELAEPLLRHHLQYRDNHGSELTLIVELLGAWFDQTQRRTLLVDSPVGSLRESYLAATLRTGPERFDSAYGDRDITALASEARLWARGEGSGPLASKALGQVIVEMLAHLPDGLQVQERQDWVGHRLDQLSPAEETDATRAALIGTCWNGHESPSTAVDRLRSLAAPGLPAQLALAVKDEAAYWLAESGDIPTALTEYEQVIHDRTATLGPTHPDTLISRHNHAYWLAESGDITTALTEYEQVIHDRTATLGPTHPNTLASRHSHAYWLAQSGGIDTALTEIEQVIHDQTTTLGPTHPNTLASRHNHAGWLAESGDITTALTEYEQVIHDRTATLGPTHPNTLISRHNHADWLAESGDITTALTEIEQVIHDSTATLGPTHPDTLISRHNHADWLAQTGDIDTALQVTRRIVVDLDDAGGGDPLRYALTVTAQLAVRCGLHHVGENLADANVADLLRRVAMRSDARAFAALPAEVRALIAPDEGPPNG